MMIAIAGYHIREKIYESGNSVVYQGYRKEDNQPVILKLLKNDYPTPASLIKYKREYELIRNLNLEGVVKTYSLEKYQNTLVMILEDFGGKSLKILMGHHKFSLKSFLKIAICLTDIIREIHHKQIIHKDINPSNIVFNPQTEQIKLIDFGISTILSRQNTTFKNPNILEGTLAYISPEQTGRMNRAIDYRTDFYSLGVTFYELLTYQLPFDTSDAMELVHCHIAKQATAPYEINRQIPQVVSDIVMKLLAKAAEERYQTAWGIQADLELCLHQLETEGNISSFTICQQDISDKFQISPKLYGRKRELETLLLAFERVSQGAKEMMLISGYSGIGKSALVQEIYKPITRQRGYFIAGKFDQFQRNIPYSALVSAFVSLMRQILTENEDQLNRWKEKLQSALGNNGQIIIDVVPEVELIIGPQPPVQVLGLAESQNRFNLLFQKFIQVFCAQAHPLVIFLDDLQWADSATLKLLELMINDEDTPYLFLIGAYRDNEVTPTHPLLMTIQALRNNGNIINQIVLSPLNLEHIVELIADTLHDDKETVQPLGFLIMEKTGGNPFFVNEFLKTLEQENLLAFDFHQKSWQWQIDKIQQINITDNVVHLMVSKLKKLPQLTQHILRLAACLGNQFDLNTLSIIHEKSTSETFKDLWMAIQLGLILPASELETTAEDPLISPLLIINFKFLHDRVQQAAYALIPEELQKEIHLKIGRLLWNTIGIEQKSEKIFELVEHLNAGRELITDKQEKLNLVKLNLVAGKKAKNATAYAAAREYFALAMQQILTENIWDNYYDLAFELYKRRAEVEYLNGNFEQSEELINIILEKAKSDLEKAEIYNLLIVQYTMSAKYAQAIEVGRQALAMLGINLPETNLQQALELEIAQVQANLGERNIFSLLEQKELIIPAQIVSLKLLMNLAAPTFFYNQQLFPIVCLKSVNVSIEYGHAPESCLGYANYGLILVSILQNYQLGYEFGKLAVILSEKFNNQSQKTKTYYILGSQLKPWLKHIKNSNQLFKQAYQAGLEGGELEWAGYSLVFKLFYLLYQGVNIDNISQEVKQFLVFTRKTKNQPVTDVILGLQLGLLNLSRMTIGKLDFHDEQYTETQYLPDWQSRQSLMALGLYNLFKAQILYLYDEPTAALECSLIAEQLLVFLRGFISLAEHNFYYSLSLAACYQKSSPATQKQSWEILLNNQKQMKNWAENCPENFLHKYLLVEAEIARIRSNHWEAMELYDRAIESAAENDFIQNEALANELAGKFWLSKGKENFAKPYIRKARYGYQVWGAKRKVEDLEDKYSHLITKEYKVNKTETIDPKSTLSLATTETGGSSRLDFTTVMKASQAISGEIVLDKLIAKLMKILLENAGAQKIFLILERENELYIEAVLDLDGEIRLRQATPVKSSEKLPIFVINYVARIKESVVLDDAENNSFFAADSYIQLQKPQSLLCAPILNQGKLIGILYMENNLTTNAFTTERVEVMTILSTQAAISIKNARLYEQLEDYSHNLEVKVEERTQELKDKNEQLKQALSQLKSAQRQIVAQEKLASLGSLTAGVAHEIRNPLNFINNFAALSADLAEELSEEISHQLEGLDVDDAANIRLILSDLVANVEEIKKQGQRADSIIENMLLHARHKIAQPKLTNLNDLVAESIQLSYHSLRSKYPQFNITIKPNYDNSIGQINIVPQDISRALINVMNNACYAVYAKHKALNDEFMPQVSIITKNVGHSVEIRFKDNGEGISQSNLDKIFNPFFTTKPPGEGTGLGLSLTHDIIVGQHQGEIKVETELGAYTEFILVLPKQSILKQKFANIGE